MFLDKKSTHQDHYWAVEIHKAIHASFPECGETHAAMTKPPGRLSSGKVSRRLLRLMQARNLDPQ
jgi:hypothetical protein